LISESVSIENKYLAYASVGSNLSLMEHLLNRILLDWQLQRLS